VRISFSFADPTAIGLLSVIPQQNNPGPRTVNDLVNAVRRNLSECRRLWWLYQQNNPLLHTEGACCLNNSRSGGKTVIDATYDPGNPQHAATVLRRRNDDLADVGVRMISQQDIQKATAEGTKFKPVILAAKYHRDTDRVELVTQWCVLILDRNKIDELRHLSPNEMETISVSAVGLHVEKADIDINSAGLITDISKQLEAEVANSF
jgi:hypothetical protein